MCLIKTQFKSSVLIFSMPKILQAAKRTWSDRKKTQTNISEHYAWKAVSELKPLSQLVTKYATCPLHGLGAHVLLVTKTAFCYHKIQVKLYLSTPKLHNITVVVEKNETFTCDIILERYIYLCTNQKQIKITSYGRNKRFLEFYIVYKGVRLKFLGSLL